MSSTSPEVMAPQAPSGGGMRVVRIIGIVVADVAIVVLAVLVALLNNRVSRLDTDISQLQAQQARLQAQQRASVTSQQVSVLRSQMAAVTARLQSANPLGDLITCTDLQALGLQNTYGVTVDNAGNITLNQTPVVLPQHCLKQ